MSLVEGLKSVDTPEQLRDLLHPDDLFTGYKSLEQVYTTVKRRLTEIAESNSTYLELASEAHNMHCFALEPFRRALLALSIREQWPQEVLHQGILANTGWLEEVNTRLRHRAHDEHQPESRKGNAVPRMEH